MVGEKMGHKAKAHRIALLFEAMITCEYHALESRVTEEVVFDFQDGKIAFISNYFKDNSLIQGPNPHN
jgi:hypothetical protein